jgi:IS30 family transposase
MKRGYRPWTMRDDEKLEQLLSNNVSMTEIAKRMGRARQVIQRKRDEWRGPEYVKYQRVVVDADFRIEIPEEVLVDRERRAQLTRRDLTAVLMGDPPIGLSALERRA